MDTKMAKSASAGRRGDETKTGLGIKIVLIAVAVLCVLALVYTICDATGVLARSTTAMKVGDDSISAMELRQYYGNTRSSVLSQYGSTLQAYGYDLSSSTFELQTCLFDSSRTWKQYFTDQAEASAQQISVLVQQAEENGFTYDTAQDVQDYLDGLQSAADDAGYSLSKYLRLAYGKGTKVSDVESYYAKRALAVAYYDSVIEGFGIGDSEIMDYYAEHIGDYTLISYNEADFAYTTYTYDAEKASEEGAPKSEAEAEKMTADSKAEAMDNAQALLADLKEDGANFGAAARKYISDEDAPDTWLSEDVKVSSATAAGPAWAADSARVAGDVELVEDEDNGKIAVMQFVSRRMDDSYTVAVRHILLRTETAASDADDAAKAEIDAANAQVKQQAEELLAQWKAGEATEDSFAQLAKENSADSNAADGGLYTGVYEGQMVDTFNDWCFDPARKSGDTGIVETSYGYHIMYFVENEGLKYISDIRSTLESQEYNDWYDTEKGQYPVTTEKLGMMFL